MKKFLLAIAFVMVLTLVFALPVMAAPKVPEPPPVEGAREAVILNAGFHCNAQGGNGRV